MQIFDSIKDSISSHFERKKVDREMMERLEKDAENERRIIFQQEFKKNALEVARSKAKEDAAKMSGLQRLRAKSRSRNLDRSSANPPGSFFEKFAEYTQKNMARRDENLKRTEMMRSEAEKIKAERARGKTPIVERRKSFSNNRQKSKW